MNNRGHHATGMVVRHAVLGDAHAGRTNTTQTDLAAPFQDLVTRYAWGEIWTRPGLPRHTCSLLVIVMTVALGCDGELRLHLCVATNNSVTRDKIQKTLLQTVICCGVPAANHTLHLAQTVFAKTDTEGVAKKQYHRFQGDTT